MHLPQKLCALFVCATLPATLFSQAAAVSVSASPIKVPNSVVLNGTVTWTAGATQDSGNATLTVLADGSTQETWNLGKQPHSSKQGSLAGSRSCQITDLNGQTRDAADLGCYRPINWFAPWLGDKLVADGSVVKTDSTGNVERGAGQIKSTYKVLLPSLPGLNTQQQAALNTYVENTAVDVVYDAKTMEPVRIAFQEHPFSDPGRNIDVDVIFADYRPEGTLLLPHHIQRYIQHSLQVDFQISSITIQ